MAFYIENCHRNLTVIPKKMLYSTARIFTNRMAERGLVVVDRIPKLEGIIKDLKGIVGDCCDAGAEHPQDFVGEMCTQACLMLEEAREKLNAEKAERKS